jgi:hypothetical protein
MTTKFNLAIVGFALTAMVNVATAGVFSAPAAAPVAPAPVVAPAAVPAPAPAAVVAPVKAPEPVVAAAPAKAKIYSDADSSVDDSPKKKEKAQPTRKAEKKIVVAALSVSQKSLDYLKNIEMAFATGTAKN